MNEPATSPPILPAAHHTHESQAKRPPRLTPAGLRLRHGPVRNALLLGPRFTARGSCAAVPARPGATGSGSPETRLAS